MHLQNNNNRPLNHIGQFDIHQLVLPPTKDSNQVPSSLSTPLAPIQTLYVQIAHSRLIAFTLLATCLAVLAAARVAPGARNLRGAKRGAPCLVRSQPGLQHSELR
jgi:hypothetical protein